jgi:hypothetical protein
MIMGFVKEVMDLLEELASGKLKIEDARKRAAVLQDQKPEQFTDLLKAELDKRLAELEGRPAADPPFTPGDIPEASDR